MKNVLVTGSNGQLGNALKEVFAANEEINPIYVDIDELDITDRQAVEEFVSRNKIDTIVNCAAYTAVDKAEDENIKAAKINTEAVGNIAQTARKHKVKVIHISTDYVFAGNNFRPYNENDEPYPRSIYGRTKLEGEGMLNAYCPDAVIIRTAWLYSEFGHNFVKTMLRLASEGQDIRVVYDQIGTPTYAGDLARAINAVISAPEWKPGIYHFTDEGAISWYDFAKAIMILSGNDHVKVSPVSTREYPTRAARPFYSVLSKSKIKSAFGLEIPYWLDSLKKCLQRIGEC